MKIKDILLLIIFLLFIPLITCAGIIEFNFTWYEQIFILLIFVGIPAIALFYLFSLFATQKKLSKPSPEKKLLKISLRTYGILFFILLPSNILIFSYHKMFDGISNLLFPICC